MGEIDLSIGQRLQQARKALGFKSARSFARQHGIPESTYSQHETGKRSLNPTTMLAYCERLRIKPGWLITGQQAEPTLDIAVLRQALHQDICKLVRPELQSHLVNVLNIHLKLPAKNLELVE